MRTEDERSSPADMRAHGQLLIDLKGREARHQGRLLDLTRLEFDLLAYLAAHPGWVVSPDELYEQVWGYQWGADRRLISVHMGNLRRKLRDAGAGPGLIDTVRGAGYKLVVPDDRTGPLSNSLFDPGAGRASSLQAARIPLVGRATELNLLTSALDMAVGGRGSLALLWGEAGIGKTRLIEELACSVKSRGMMMLWGRCLDGDALPAYWPWLQILRSLRDEIGLTELMSQAGIEADALVQMLPELRRSLPYDPEAVSIGDQYHLLQSVGRLLVGVSKDHPCLLALDDLPWADKSSLLLLQVLASELVRSRILVVGTIRNSDVPRGHPLADLLPSLLRAGATRTHLTGLGQEAVGALMEATAGTGAEPALIAAVTTETLGNPFHICELVRLLKASQPDATTLSFKEDLPLPPTISEIVARRAQQLSGECQELLDLCSLAGRSMNYLLLHRASGLDRDSLLKLLGEAIDAQLLEEESRTGHYRFSHPLVQETLSARIGHLCKLKLHARLADSLVRLYEKELEPHLPELAHHCYQATPLGYAEQAAQYNLGAGRQALRQLAFEQAAACFSRGLEALGFIDTPDPRLRPELLVELGEARAAAFDPAAGEIYREAADQARQVGAWDLLARAALGFEGRTMGPHSVDAERSALLEEALTLLPDSDSHLRVQIMSLLSKGLAELAHSVAPADDPLSRRRRSLLCDEAVAMAKRIGDRTLLAYALNTRWYALFGPDNLDQRLADAREALALAGAGADPSLRWNCTMNWAFQTLEIEQIDACIEHLGLCVGMAKQFRVPFFVSVSCCFRALPELWRGNLREAARLIEESADPWGDDKDWLGLAMQLMFAHSHALLEGDRREMAKLEAPLRSLAPSDPLGWAWKVRLTLLLARLGRMDEAGRQFDELAAHDFVDLPREQGFVLFAVHLAETATLLGDRARARALYALLAPYERRSATAFQFFDGPVSHFLGLLAGALGQWERAVAHLEDSIARCAMMRVPPYEVRSRIALAEVLQGRGYAGNRGEARVLLEDALSRAESMGMIAYAEQARRLIVVEKARWS